MLRLNLQKTIHQLLVGCVHVLAAIAQIFVSENPSPSKLLIPKNLINLEDDLMSTKNDCNVYICLSFKLMNLKIKGKIVIK
jgi:hypothetical protein